MSSFIVLQYNIGSGSHTLVRWPKDVTLGDLVRERFECKEETELMFCVPTPKGFLNWHESNIINEVEVRGYADGCDNPFVVTVTDKAASSREVRDHEVFGRRIKIHMDTFNQHTSVPGFHQRPPKRSIKNFEALKDHFVRVLGDHKNVVKPVLVICPVCKRAIRLSNSGTITDFVRGHLKAHKEKSTLHGEHVYEAFSAKEGVQLPDKALFVVNPTDIFFAPNQFRLQ